VVAYARAGHTLCVTFLLRSVANRQMDGGEVRAPSKPRCEIRVNYFVLTKHLSVAGRKDLS